MEPMPKMPKIKYNNNCVFKIKGCSAYSFNCLGCWSSSPPTSTIPFSLTLPVNLIQYNNYSNGYNNIYTCIILVRYNGTAI